jgi:hypothetical protein
LRDGFSCPPGKDGGVSAVGSYVFDWNDTHIYNLEWTAHAKFHNAQTMSTVGHPAAHLRFAAGGLGHRARDQRGRHQLHGIVGQLSAAVEVDTRG